jgi:4-hydroxythreonine-4-phosphate dehydrogenase
MGDPAGIGIEIALKAFTARQTSRVPPFVLYADPDAVAERARALGLTVPQAELASAAGADKAFATALPIVPVKLATRAVAGTPAVANAAAVIAAIEAAVAAVFAGEAAAIVTNPIAKHVLAAQGFAHPGHTEFLGALAKRHAPKQPATPVMMLASPQLRVVPLTVHRSLASVPGAVTRGLIVETLRILDAALKSDFAIPAPRIAVAGLNPHAGEAGGMGREEIDIITPALNEARALGISISGPHPADTMFTEAARKTYDAAVGMYHDQALIPFKTLAFEEGVNVTLGLPIVRTSPDHGTAFDIAAKGSASPASFIESLRLAASIATARHNAHAT